MLVLEGNNMFQHISTNYVHTETFVMHKITQNITCIFGKYS